jgi:hypothetical protein
MVALRRRVGIVLGERLATTGQFIGIVPELDLVFVRKPGGHAAGDEGRACGCSARPGRFGADGPGRALLNHHLLR